MFTVYVPRQIAGICHSPVDTFAYHQTECGLILNEIDGCIHPRKFDQGKDALVVAKRFCKRQLQKQSRREGK